MPRQLIMTKWIPGNEDERRIFNFTVYDDAKLLIVVGAGNSMNRYRCSFTDYYFAKSVKQACFIFHQIQTMGDFYSWLSELEARCGNKSI